MGLGQTMLTIMALMLMGRLILSTNTLTLDTGLVKDMAEYRIAATSLGISMLETAEGLAFDENTVDNEVSLASGMTAPASLGPEAGETSLKLFTDIDDLNNLVKIDTIPSSAVFKTLVTVSYDSINGSSIVTSTVRTFSKLVTIKVTSDYMKDYSLEPPKQDTLTFQKVFCYWYMR